MPATTPDSLFELAERLVKEAGPARRAGVGRAYYAAFHSLQDILSPACEDEDFGDHGAIHHHVVLRLLRTWRQSYPDPRMRMSFGAEALKQYNYMVSCKSARERCDYSLCATSDPQPPQAVEAVGKARRVIQFAKKVRQALERTQFA